MTYYVTRSKLIFIIKKYKIFNVNFLYYSNTGIPKLYIEAGRKRHPVTHKLSDSELSNDITNDNKSIDVSSSTIVQELDEKEYEDETLNDEQREVMEDIWLKADEMGR